MNALFCQTDMRSVIDIIRGDNMKKNIEVHHYNRKRERIDIHSEESRAKIEKAVAEVVSRMVSR